MRSLIFLLLFFFSLPVLAQDVTVTVSGMTCQPCADTMEKKFSKEESVKNVSASFETQKIIIDEKDNITISDEKIAEIINWGGYDLKEISRN